MNPISLATGRWGPSLALLMCRVLSPCQIDRLGGRLASHLARRQDLAFVNALRANTAVVHGLPPEHKRVDEVVARLLHNAILSYADLFRALQVGPEEVRAACGFDPAMIAIVEACLASGRGLVLVGAHMCSFDLLLLGLKSWLPSIQVLSNADPRGSSWVMNEIRAKHGLEVTPISMRALRQAVERLRQGGIVAIAAGIPVESGEPLTFFGHRAQLPVGHARLALGTDARMIVGLSHRVGEGRYWAEVMLVPRPQSTGDRKQDVIRWAQSSLSVLEGLIHRCPEEWLMPIPVWPQVLPMDAQGRRVGMAFECKSRMA